MRPVSISLIQHWKEALKTSSGLCAKVYRFLMRFYGEQASHIVFPPRPVPTGFILLDSEARPKPPRTPDQIRSLLTKITEAVRRSTADVPW